MTPASASERLAEARRSAAPSVWLNGVRQSPEGPHVSATDRGLTLADGLFETMLIRSGRVFRLDAHLARLERGLHVLGMAVPATLREWVAAAVSDAEPDASLRLTVTRGAGPGGATPPPRTLPTVVVTVSGLPPLPLVPPRDAGTDELVFGCIATVASGRRNPRSITAGLKTLAYTENVAAAVEAHRAGANESIFLDTDDHCSEATASNLFVWSGDVLLTPPVSCGVLPGVTRDAVIEVARVAGLRVDDRPFGLDELTGGDEAFLTSSLRGVAPLLRVDRHWIGSGRPGARTRELAAAYEALVARECGA